MTMKKLLLVIITLNVITIVNGQQDFHGTILYGDTLNNKLYDTLRIELESKVIFPFCSNTYQIPRDCDKPYPPNCCTYSTNMYNGQKVATYGNISCLNGSSLIWYYISKIEDARRFMENMVQQLKPQFKTFKQTVIKCEVLGQETMGYLLESETTTGYKSNRIITVGNCNGYTVYLEYSTSSKLSSNLDIQPIIKQILKFKE